MLEPIDLKPTQITYDDEYSNYISFSAKKTPSFYICSSEKYLQTFEEYELLALGNATSTSAIAAENLVK